MLSDSKKLGPKGYSLIELVLVLILLGIVSVSVLPKFFDKSGFAENAYQARLVSALRTMQERAMQDTRNTSNGTGTITNFCYQIGIFRDADSAFGPSTMNFVDTSDANQLLSCTRFIDDDPELEYMTATNNDMLTDDVQVTAGPDQIAFSSMGCPIVGGIACASSVQVDITGLHTRSVCVESQGYIHVGSCD